MTTRVVRIHFDGDALVETEIAARDFYVAPPKPVPLSWSSPSDEEENSGFWEMPGKIKALETIDGEVFATLVDGRTIRVTDLFSKDRPQ